MNTAHVVSMVEKSLPVLQKREWVMRSQEISQTSELFPELLKFLIREREIIEYMDSSIRNSIVTGTTNNALGMPENGEGYDVKDEIRNQNDAREQTHKN